MPTVLTIRHRSSVISGLAQSGLDTAKCKSLVVKLSFVAMAELSMGWVDPRVGLGW